MSFFIALAIAVLPAVLLLIYIFKKDAKPEPKGKIWKAILLGAATVIPIICVEQNQDPNLGLFFPKYTKVLH